jgi:hypothetical protein
MKPNLQEPIAGPTPSRRRWFRFRMRSLLAFTTLAACILGWVAIERRQSTFERQIGNELMQRQSGCSIIFLGPYHSLVLDHKNEPQGWWRDLARKVFGERISIVYFLRDQDSLKLLAGLVNLKSLTLSGTSIYDLTPLSGLNDLEELSILDAPVGDLTPLAELNNLEELNLTRTPTSDLSALGGLVKLKTLCLARTPIRDLAPLAELTNLEELRLIHTPATDLAPLIGLTNLQELQVPAISVSDPTPLVALKNLKFLHLTGSSFVSELFQLSGPKSFERLWQSHPCISDKQFEYLQQALPNCKIKRSGRRPSFLTTDPKHSAGTFRCQDWSLRLKSRAALRVA